MEQKKKTEEEPKWYHYVIVLSIIAAIVGVFYLSYQIFFDKKCHFSGSLIDYYKLEYKNEQGESKYYCSWHTKSTLENFKLHYEINLPDLLNAENLIYTRNLEDENSKGDLKHSQLNTQTQITFNYGIKTLTDEKYQSYTCKNSTKKNKVVHFKKSNKTGVYYNKQNGCISFEAKNISQMPLIVEKIIYELIIKN